MRSRKRQRGFTLIEMLVATILLAIGIVGTLGAISASTRASAIADGIHTATLLGQQKLSDIEMQASNLTGGDQQGDFGDDYAGYRWRQSVETTNYQNLFKVTVTIQWGAPPAPREQAFTTYLRNDQGQQSQNGAGSGTQNRSGPGSNSAGGLGSG